MNFREFFLLNELRYYYAYKEPNGQYVASDMFTSSQQRDSKAAQLPQGTPVWRFEVQPGNPAYNATVFQNLPNASEKDKENIGVAYYSRFGYHRPTYTNFQRPEDNSEFIDPEFMDPNYNKQPGIAQQMLSKKANSGGTINYRKPKPPEGPTIDYPNKQ